jgi:surface antigen
LFSNLIVLKPLLTKWAIACIALSAVPAGYLSESLSNHNEKTQLNTKQPVIAEIKAQPLKPTALKSGATPIKKKVTKPTNKPAVKAILAGNSYTAGNCTWYAKSRRPDLPNNLGNAISWVSSARSQGLQTGSKPKVGAIGQQGNHVVYIEKINRDGSVLISEMNWEGLGVVSKRTVPASSFTYIY